MSAEHVPHLQTLPEIMKLASYFAAATGAWYSSGDPSDKVWGDRAKVELQAAIASIIAANTYQARQIERYRDQLPLTSEKLAQMERNRDMWKGQVDRQAEQLAKFHAAARVQP